jgi:hypothetical protein
MEILFSACRLDQHPSPDGFMTQAALAFSVYSEATVCYVTDPLTGIQRKRKWPPVIAELVEACEHAKAAPLLERLSYEQDPPRNQGRCGKTRSMEAKAQTFPTEKHGRGRPTGYTPEACNQLVTLMSAGLSLTASAGVMGIGRTTVHRWMASHEEFRHAVQNGQAARTFKLETLLLETTSATVARFCCLALVNAAPEEWAKKRARR